MKVLVYPKDKNPYQNLLYSKVSTEIPITYVENPTSSHLLGVLLLPLLLLYYRVKGYSIFHLHWFYNFQLTVQNPFFHSYPFKLFFTLYFLFFLLTLKILKYKVVWTVHDVLPHGSQFIDDQFVVKVLSYLTTAKIVHSKNTIRLMKNLGMNARDVHIIPIGNYMDVFPDTVTTAEARKYFEYSSSDFVFGFFGRIEYYKGIIELLQAFTRLHLPRTKLLIAGPCFNKDLEREILTYSEKNENIQFRSEFVPDEKVQYFIKAADIFVFPFQRITTSSSVILALSFGKTVIAPLVGEISDLPKETGFYYGPAEGNSGLVRYMENVFADREEIRAREKSALQYVTTISWTSIGKRTSELYKSISSK